MTVPPPPSPERRCAILYLRRALTGVLLMALTAGLAGWAVVSVLQAVGARMAEEAPGRPARETVLAVNTVRIAPGPETPVLTVFGEIQSRRTVELRAAAGGTVASLSPTFVEGGRVAAGAELLAIDPVAAEAVLALARADLADAEAELRDARRTVGLSAEELAVSEEAAELRAQSLSRQNDLQGRGVGSAASVEEAALAASSARQAVVQRRQALAAAEAAIDLAGTRLTRARVALAEAERALTETRVTAPFEGTLAEVAPIEGGRVAAGEVLARLVDADALEVAFRLSTAQYARLLGEGGACATIPSRSPCRSRGSTSPPAGASCARPRLWARGRRAGWSSPRFTRRPGSAPATSSTCASKSRRCRRPPGCRRSPSAPAAAFWSWARKTG